MNDYTSVFDDEQLTFQVVANDEEQYSIWPVTLPMPGGWRALGPSGLRVECLEYIEQTWTDMRPKSLRDEMDRRPPDAAGNPERTSDGQTIAIEGGDE